VSTFSFERTIQIISSTLYQKFSASSCHGINQVPPLGGALAKQPWSAILLSPSYINQGDGIFTFTNLHQRGQLYPAT